MDVAERREKVAAMVRAGKSERQIAAALNVSRTTVFNDKAAIRNVARKAERKAAR